MVTSRSYDNENRDVGLDYLVLSSGWGDASCLDFRDRRLVCWSCEGQMKNLLEELKRIDWNWIDLLIPILIILSFVAIYILGAI